MREVEKTVVYELTPEEREDATFEKELIYQIGQGWEAVDIPYKNRMQFDANYNRYYAKVTYERTS